MGEFERHFENQQSSQDPLEEQDYLDTKEVKPVNITYEDIEEIKFPLPLEQLEYKGKGLTSFSKEFDNDKRDWLKDVGIEIPEDAESSEVITAFNIVKTIMFLKHIYNRNIESGHEELTRPVIFTQNITLQKNRIDTDGYTDIATWDGKTVEEVAAGIGIKLNVNKRVNVLQYNRLVETIIARLKRTPTDLSQ